MGIRKPKGKQKPRALFVVKSTAQAEMFAPIGKGLPDWGIMAISINPSCEKREQVEKVLQRLNFPYRTFKTPEAPWQGRVKRILRGERPAIVVVGHATAPVEGLFVKSANSMGIPTLLIQERASLSRHRSPLP